MVPRTLGWVKRKTSLLNAVSSAMLLTGAPILPRSGRINIIDRIPSFRTCSYVDRGGASSQDPVYREFREPLLSHS
ncbi:hypothetical protein SUGI_1513490 [Cryptomeria japonica]|uniref:Uncharacterized protein n=1 Tax=Cryptomeria japonica TaxID=3369 RepID=A0AAD3RRA9_CRYJA|nr:hypothetical protein SUGI_1469190 [Cryptomeria japonica]GLJ58754.1 hypothetical protein SUGI_1474310 [Cryptomeria japonica]GLJ59089.1 hypothetical protein SUGI_1492290 [Cryptomeria japonica]GLJ59198.1 hypothetical protein SUGI_1497230 [Cryptomeria japonica]GLJ59290.1 hypothetical protein SUGI_1501420 [Cryptomeria japonica]